MLRYDPGASLAHSLDPRSKLAVQVGFAGAAFAHTTPTGLATLTAVTGGVLAAARLSPVAVAVDIRYVLPILVAGPILEGVRLGPPWFSVSAATFPALASYRVLLILFVSAAYVQTTPVRESRAAIQWLVPGKPGQFLGMGVSFVFRFLPVLRADLSRARDAMHARLGTELPLTERMRLVAVSGFARAFDRADRLSLALRARCLSWNPTLPPLTFGTGDVAATLVALALAGSVLL
ncbi:energy-coupling factor transporter transmembrane component T family protein [Halorientalis litorea]|jgi:biotin transport system permease protein|uniref:energy-coupling factor transporter transmembrane component T family protein n=1 Tax=Halorientalis litorea TaxID=2931977 RepID=UPI001FF1C407|nr:energy-coupling factor transporter transmembrane component T [Halorientalis litorea]